MAYMNQERKATIASKVKPILAKYGMKGTLSVRNHSTIVLKLTSGPIDFIGDLQPQRQFGYVNYELNKDEMRKRYELSINPYWYTEHYTGESLQFLSEIFSVLNEGNHDRSDITTDYFDVGWYVDVNVGTWQKPYVLTR